MTSCLSGLGSSKAHLKSQAKPHRKQRAGKGAKKKGEQDHRERGRMAVKGASEPEEVTLKSAPNKSEDSSPIYLHQLERAGPNSVSRTVQLNCQRIAAKACFGHRNWYLRLPPPKASKPFRFRGFRV